MPDSVGAGGFPRNINIGHEHLDMSSGFTYQYQGGVPTNILSWKIINGVSATDPSTSGWGAKQIGAMWFNNSEKVYKYWDGVAVQILASAAAGGLKPLYDYHSGLYVQDDFMTGGLTDGQVGALGWGSGGTITAGTGTAANPGQLGLATGAGSGTVARINMLGGNQMGVPGVFDLTWIFKVGTNDTNTSIRAGISNNWTGDPPTNGIYLEKVYADTNWFVVTRAASTETRTDTGVAVGTAAFLKVQLVGIGTSVLFYINNVLVATHSENIPATGVGPGIHIINNAAANKTMVVDYFEITIEGLTR